MTGAADRLTAAALVWLLMLTWGSGIVIGALALGGVSGNGGYVSWWVVVIAVLGVVATGVPLLRWLRPAVDSLLFSHPEAAGPLISQFTRQLQDGPVDPDGRAGLADEIAAQIAFRLRLPYVAIVRPGESAPAGLGGQVPPEHRLVRVPLTFTGEQEGTLLVTPRTRDRQLGNGDLALLHELAIQIGISLHAATVTDKLRTSRAALVTAREEERRRIRRDLHDGLGPALASLRLHLAALEQLIPSQPDEALVLLDRLRGEVRDTSAQIRGLVYDLRPPTLDEFGLLGALRSRAAGLAANTSGAGVDVRVEIPDPLPELPAAVEVALFRIASEGLENIGRHSGAGRAWLRMELCDGQVHLQVDDDGRGLPEPLVPGVGLAGMRERVQELRGRLDVGSRSPEPGTRILAVLPVGHGSGRDGAGTAR